jgi:dynein light chain Tctex-type 1
MTFYKTVNCVIMQKNGAGLHSSVSCFWDGANDNSAQLKWSGEKKKDAVMQVIVTVYGIAH